MGRDLVGADITSWATLAVAAATVASVALTVLFQTYVPGRRRPSLTLEYKPPREGGSRDINYIEHDQSTWLRFRVRNADGKDVARDVEVLLADVRPGGAPAPSAFPARTLHWSDQEDPWRRRLDIPGGIYRHIDVGHIHPTVSPDIFRLALEPQDPNPRESREQLRAGHYTLYFILVAANANAARYDAEILLKQAADAGSVLSVEVLRGPTQRMDRAAA